MATDNGVSKRLQSERHLENRYKVHFADKTVSDRGPNPNDVSILFEGLRVRKAGIRPSGA